ncbi:SoxR reducing system RseC family protein [Planctobacterium marinum]|uniref:Fis family transcriptional regulator n=1 Tax=Planctobacterium marinum TaxID=1631968 RepID=A0AA48KPZ9_9ALTE|nr:hypothetical protein MACH26_27370 [Planctobacterium marinum]
MQEEIATVIDCKDGIVEVSTKIKNTCDGCEQSSHCGTGLLARYLAPKPENLRLKSNLALRVGQKIKIGLPDALLLKLAFAIYFVPILILVLVASVLSSFIPGISELVLVASSVGAATLWFPLLRFLIQQHHFELTEPEILQVFEQDETPVKFVSTP